MRRAPSPAFFVSFRVRSVSFRWHRECLSTRADTIYADTSIYTRPNQTVRSLDRYAIDARTFTLDFTLECLSDACAEDVSL